MNAPQNNLLATGQSVSNALETITATNVPPALTAAHVALKTMLTDIQTLATSQATPTTGITADRDTVFASAIDATLVVAGLVLSYAKNQKLGDLASKVDFTSSDFTRGRFGARVRTMQQVHDAAASVMAGLADFGVTAATLTDLQAKIDAARTQLSEPRDAIVARRVATEKLAEAHTQLKSLLNEQLDPLIEARRTTDPDGYKLYQAARVVIDRPGTPAASPSNPPSQPALSPPNGPVPTPAAAGSAPPGNTPAAPMASVTKLAA